MSRAAKNLALKLAKLHPTAAVAAKARKKLGDTASQPVLDALITGVKRRRESRANDKAMGY